jgi:hypothetical protein
LERNDQTKPGKLSGLHNHGLDRNDSGSGKGENESAVSLGRDQPITCLHGEIKINTENSLLENNRTESSQSGARWGLEIKKKRKRGISL